MTSHEYAEELKKTVEHLLARPDVEFESGPFLYVSFWEKEKFIAATRAMGSGKKEFSSTDDLHFMPVGTCLTMSIGRDTVCRKIQDVKWECEPLLSEEEVAAVGSAS
jgi:hypothetical protein